MEYSCGRAGHNENLMDLAKKREKKQKHEEIKRMAWEMLRGCSERELSMCMLDDKDNTDINTEIIRGCWKIAEEFYNFAKEKEGADEETDKD